MTEERMEVERAIAAGPAAIFGVVSDPQGHVTIDSSGMLMSATGDRVRAVGDRFVVHMDREALNDFPLGLYDVTVEIVTFEQDREIAWTIIGQLKPQIGHVYGYRLDPMPEGTLVTSYYDWSNIDPVWKERSIFPVIPESALRATLGILARTVAPGVPRPIAAPAQARRPVTLPPTTAVDGGSRDMSTVAFDFVPMGRDIVRDPYPAYERMRETGRVLRTSYGATIVHRYGDVREVHLDHERFSMGAMGGGMMRMASAEPAAGGMAGGEFMMAETMLTADPPDHERLRRVVNRAFTPRSIADLEPRVREICRELLAPLAKGEPFDLVADFAAPLPTIVIAELLGIPPEDGHKFRMWTEAVTGTDVRQRTDRSRVGGFGVELRDYLAEQIERRKSAPTDDLIGRMVAANEEQIMTDAEVVASCVLLLIAGNETTMRLITNMALTLSRHPDQLELLLGDRELLAGAVEETLRFESPVHMLFRGVKQDCEVGGVELHAGQAVLTMLAAANRDPEAFERADAYDVTRTDNLHVALGHGIHYCLGAPLARRETRVAFEELLDTVGRFEVVTPDDELDYPQMLMLRSPRSLVIRQVS